MNNNFYGQDEEYLLGSDSLGQDEYDDEELEGYFGEDDEEDEDFEGVDEDEEEDFEGIDDDEYDEELEGIDEDYDEDILDGEIAGLLEGVLRETDDELDNELSLADDKNETDLSYVKGNTLADLGIESL